MIEIGDRIACKVHRYLTHVWIGGEIPTQKRCSGIVVRKIHDMCLVQTDDGERFAAANGCIRKLEKQPATSNPCISI